MLNTWSYYVNYSHLLGRLALGVILVPLGPVVDVPTWPGLVFGVEIGLPLCRPVLVGVDVDVLLSRVQLGYVGVVISVDGPILVFIVEVVVESALVLVHLVLKGGRRGYCGHLLVSSL